MAPPSPASSSSRALPRGIQVFERGWLSSNNVLLHGEGGGLGDGATLVDTGHARHAEQTAALLDQALGGARLARIVNTHLHADHCGGNAHLQSTDATRAGQAAAARPAAPTLVPAGVAEAVATWDRTRLSHAPTGQHCPRFSAQGTLQHGDALRVGGRRWEVLGAPGHDPDALMLFAADEGVLISADALWEHGFGVVFPELEGEQAFDDVQTVLDRIASLPVAWVIPGHGPAFTDVAGALARARERLAGFRAAPQRHARHGAKVLIKFHVMELAQLEHAALTAWAEATPLLQSSWRQAGLAEAASAGAWCERLVGELVDRGVLGRRGTLVHDR